MGKYEALGQFLAQQSTATVPMTFAHIERLIGMSLPPSRSSAAWWDGASHEVTQAFRDAGFAADRIDSESVIFRRVGENEGSDVPQPGRHPIFGCMKGTVTIAPGVDISQADPEWADYLDEVYGPEPK